MSGPRKNEWPTEDAESTEGFDGNFFFYAFPMDHQHLLPLMKTQLIFEEESYLIRGGCFEVYKEKGCGFTEPIYQECLVTEMQIQDIPCDPQQAIPLIYKGGVLTHRFIPDLVCFGKIIVELKAVSQIVDEHRSQIMNYVHATGMRLGLLVNFGHHPMIQIERFVN